MSIPKGNREQHRHSFLAHIHRQFLVAKERIARLCELQRRRHQGVNTAEISPVWRDSLKSWRECPPELEKEKKSRFLATPFVLREKDANWLVFTRSYYQITFPHLSKPRRTIHNPRRDFWRHFRRHKSSPQFYRLSDHIAVNTQTGEVRRFVNIALNEVIYDLLDIRPAPFQKELGQFWGKREVRRIREKTRELFQQQFRDRQE